MGTLDAPFSLDGARAKRLKAIVGEHFDFVWRSLRRLGVPVADADDAAQNVFLVAARRLDEIMAQRERTFLFATAVRVASTFRRTARRHLEEPSPALEQVQALGMNPEELSELARARPILQGILEAMPIEQRSVFILSELEELESQVVADMLDLPLGTVYSRLRSARQIFQSAARRLSARESFQQKVK
jgi:RNA polymerase sigma-70 factor (ECF subfamily)